MRGAMGRKVSGPPAARPFHPGPGHGVDAPTEGEEDVLVSPDHPLGHAGGAAGVEDVDVVAGAAAEIALGRSVLQGLLETDGVRTGIGFLAVVVDDDDMAEDR
jgi:hypothetical protein